MMSAGIPSLNMMDIFVDTFVWVKAATRDALEDRGPFRSPK